MTLQLASGPAVGVDPKAFFPVRVKELRPEAAGILSLGLERPDGGDLPEWTPGAHIDVQLPGGMLRQYSLCSDPADHTAWRVSVLLERAGRGGSSYVHERLRPGDVLQARGPRNNFAAVPGAGTVLFIAGGIGITPLLPMVRAAAARGADWRLLYLGAGRTSMAFLAELDGIGAAAERVRIHAKDESGPLSLDDYLAGAAPDGDVEVFACGPERLLLQLRAARACGAVAVLHSEDFSNAPEGAEPVEGGTTFVVETADGTEIGIAADETILEALERVGIPALNSCRKGTCGTCETSVLAGLPDHRDEILSDEERAENSTMMICVSRSKGERLVLDL
ncbi:PDR/VanB family oxidoreductase [Pseudarthrobacter sp. P1]|uniref:PDR/VanB family oxidoreductase n=1 Tax=Pseudarthrobacter sp. P1 TaxID=3418418 RepID=UPI003CE9F955